MPLPALRYIDIVPVEQDDGVYVCLRDPLGYVEDQVLLSGGAFFIASQLNGANEVIDIQYLFARETGGQVLSENDVRRVVDYLDEHGFLYSPRFEELRRQAEAAYAALPSRPAYLAGKAYPDDPAELRAFIDAFFTENGGPGRGPNGPVDGAKSLRCLVAPHIDFERGGPTYAHGYLRMSEGAAPHTVFVFGVAHATPGVPFILTRKGFDTPFGVLETDVAVVQELAGACSWNPFEDELIHKTEHSIEFQAVMLAYLFGANVKVVPVLTGLFLDDVPDQEPASFANVRHFLAKCREIAARDPERTSVIAAADLAHVGKRFGDSYDISEAVVAKVGARDAEDLTHVTTPNADAWYRSVMKDDNARRVCGLNCIYSALKTAEGVTRGDLLHYGYAPDPAGGIVTFSSIALS